jgi:hypothetical protein
MKTLFSHKISRLKLLMIGISIAFCTLSSHGATLEVPSPDNQYDGSIQKAINQAESGDIILVHPGTYVENIELWEKKLILQSKEGAGKTTILAKDSLRSVVMLKGASIRGFTITGGTGHPVKSSYGHDYYGGGVYAGGESTIEDCIIHNNGHGTAKKNAGTFAGGIYAGSGSKVTLRNSLVLNNYAWACGGAVLVDYGGRMRIENSTIFGNESTNFFGHQGGVGMANGGQVDIVNSLLWGNSGDQIGAFSSIYANGTKADVSYSLVEGGYEGEGNLQVTNPGFTDSSNPTGADQILGTKDDGLRPAEDSLIINSANLELFTKTDGLDIAGFKRIQGSNPEIGCYEFGKLVGSDRNTPPPAPKNGPGTPPDPDYKDNIAELKRLLAEKDKKLAHCEKEMAAKNQEIETLQGKVSDLEKKVTSLDTNNKELKDQIKNLREDNQNLNYEITVTNEHLQKAIQVAETPFISGWVYDPERGWLFTDADRFPLIYTHKDQTWHYYELGSSNPRYFFNYKSQEWVAWDAIPSESDQVVANR